MYMRAGADGVELGSGSDENTVGVAVVGGSESEMVASDRVGMLVVDGTVVVVKEVAC
jgi:hypothetical protein